MGSWREKVEAPSDSAVWPVQDLLAEQHVVDASVLERRLGPDYMRMKRAMGALEGANLVTDVDKYKRGRFWCLPGMLYALDAFADPAREVRAAGSKDGDR